MRVAILLLIAVFCFGRDLQVDPLRSVVMFEARQFVFITVGGSFSDFSGKVRVENGTIKELSGSVLIDSIDTGIKKRDEHLRSADFFHSQKYPKMLLQMVSLDEEQMVVKLKIKDITKSVRLSIIDKKMNTAGLELVLSGIVDRSAFDLDNSYMSTMISDDVTMNLKIVAVE